MLYDELMKTIQLNKVYPLDGPELKTKPNRLGATYKFKVSHVSVVSRNVVRVHGLAGNAWCRVDYSFKSVPKWLKEALKKL